MEPKPLPFDQPCPNLDERSRLEMWAELQRVHIETGGTMVFVIRDPYEALALAERIVVMKDGKVIEI